jgi:hypothetical protein
VQVHSFRAEHAFIHWMVFIPFHMQFPLPVFMHYDPTTNAAIAASCFE